MFGPTLVYRGRDTLEVAATVNNDGSLMARDLLGKRKGSMEAYCVKCRQKREIKEPKAVTLKNGKPATQGTCEVCSTKIMRIGKAVESGS